ncbi:MAG: hypothetical protein RIE53_07540 [Rhodothermales bacterium]
MREICIQVPDMGSENTVEVLVTVNGEKRLTNYRVEAFDWHHGGDSSFHRIERLRAMIDGYDPGWELVQIGIPDKGLVPVMFRQRIHA